ncbi:hypothetical protein OG936_20265 [Streptomyces sp. NBC_00846]|uniref:hypothetical protein n=1 Tax=Streptomyces sp. NBC_00846 TaxID=2975849 RepID=UPI0038632E16|nr:hypothetical protein OG936_20265 [Streptomyces sp. NBC_00846]
MMRQHIRLSAVLVVVVLALTGFSTSSHGGRSGKSKGSSGSGGGCSNSKKSNGGYHRSDYDNDDSYDSSSGSSGNAGYETPAPSASDAPQAYVVRCAQPRKGKRKAVTASTVKLTAEALGSHVYDVDVAFLDARGNTIDRGEASVEAEGGETKTVSVRMDSPGKVSKVKTCRVEAELSY